MKHNFVGIAGQQGHIVCSRCGISLDNMTDECPGNQQEEQSQQSERNSLMGKLEAYESMRAQARRDGKWDIYQEACEQLAHLGRLLWLLKRNE